jgi:transmembrane sensor
MRKRARTTVRTIDDQAALWVVKQASAEDSRRARLNAQLDQWLKQDPKHLGAYVRAQAVWYELERLSALAVGTRPPRAYPPSSRLTRQ